MALFKLNKKDLRQHLHRFEAVPKTWVSIAVPFISVFVFMTGGFEYDWFKPETAQQAGIFFMSVMWGGLLGFLLLCLVGNLCKPEVK